ncbi:UxaA family hydrolase [Clostridium sp. C105KSO13]|uniref:UxaA family hydrolase n=1 Tax=Clostridium sp. C105KSO13 TaxID=1776045 RepID=UPI0007408191|nr:UxaA family hydrolase [Clostridium sp. C105KSO13]CUX19194.1 D-galactarate dehydratase [Clostridium sp. C105KSO13]
MKKALLVKVNDGDNVAIAIRDIPAGTVLCKGLTANQEIPQAHKVALQRFEKGDEVIRYGVVLGYALKTIEKGDWINEFMLELPNVPSVDELVCGTDLVTELPEPVRRTFWGYRNPNGGYAGTRNILGISTTVQCVTGVLNAAVERMRKELLPKYSNVDGIQCHLVKTFSIYFPRA